MITLRICDEPRPDLLGAARTPFSIDVDVDTSPYAAAEGGEVVVTLRQAGLAWTIRTMDSSSTFRSTRVDHCGTSVVDLAAAQDAIRITHRQPLSRAGRDNLQSSLGPELWFGLYCLTQEFTVVPLSFLRPARDDGGDILWPDHDPREKVLVLATQDSLWVTTLEGTLHSESLPHALRGLSMRELLSVGSRPFWSSDLMTSHVDWLGSLELDE